MILKDNIEVYYQVLLLTLKQYWIDIFVYVKLEKLRLMFVGYCSAIPLL